MEVKSTVTNKTCPYGSDHAECDLRESMPDVTTSSPFELQLAIDQSRLSAGMRRCYVCGAWTRNPVRSSIHKDCPHIACSLRCLFPMENNHVVRKLEMREMDDSYRSLSSAAETRNAFSSVVTRSYARSRSPRRE